jgi:Fis family transcriptional regulator
MKTDSDLVRSVRRAIDGYFRDLDGEEPCGVYEMVISCVERPLIEAVLTRVDGNQTQAAQMLGINRNTLRKKMKNYGIRG